MSDKVVEEWTKEASVGPSVVLSLFRSPGASSSFVHVGGAIYFGDVCVIKCFEKVTAAVSWSQWEMRMALKEGREEGNGWAGGGSDGDEASSSLVGALVPGLSLAIPPGLVWFVHLLKFCGDRGGGVEEEGEGDGDTRELAKEDEEAEKTEWEKAEDANGKRRKRAWPQRQRRRRTMAACGGQVEEEEERGEEEERHCMAPGEVLVLLPEDGDEVLESVVQAFCREVSGEEGMWSAAGGRRRSSPPPPPSLFYGSPTATTAATQAYAKEKTSRLHEEEEEKLQQPFFSRSMRYRIHHLPRTSAFSVASAIPRLQKMYPHTTAEVWHARLHTQQHTAMMAALSALLCFAIPARMNVWQVVETSGDPCHVYIPEDTSRFLQLTRWEPHPCEYQGVGRAKEGLSLWSILSQPLQSPRGRATLHRWFALPSREEAEVRERQAVVRFFQQPSQHERLVHLRDALHRVSPTAPLLHVLRAGKAHAGHYYRLWHTFLAYTVVYDLLQACPVATSLAFLHTCLASFTILPLREVAAMLPQTFFFSSPPRHGQGAAAPHSRRRQGGGGKKKKRNKSGEEGEGERPSAGCWSSLPPVLQPGADPTGVLEELRARQAEVSLSLRDTLQTVFGRLPEGLRQEMYASWAPRTRRKTGGGTAKWGGASSSSCPPSLPPFHLFFDASSMAPPEGFDIWQRERQRFWEDVSEVVLEDRPSTNSLASSVGGFYVKIPAAPLRAWAASCGMGVNGPRRVSLSPMASLSPPDERHAEAACVATTALGTATDNGHAFPMALAEEDERREEREADEGWGRRSTTSERRSSSSSSSSSMMRDPHRLLPLPLQKEEDDMGGGGRKSPPPMSIRQATAEAERRPSPPHWMPVALVDYLAAGCGLQYHHSTAPPHLSGGGRPPPHHPPSSSSSSSEEEEGVEEGYDLCFTTPELQSLHQWVGVLHQRLHQREVALRREIDRVVVLHSIYLLPPSEHLAALDCLLSFAVIGRRYDWTIPHILSPPFSVSGTRTATAKGPLEGPAPPPPPPSCHSFWERRDARPVVSSPTSIAEKKEDEEGMVSKLRQRLLLHHSGDGGGGVLHITRGWHPILGCALSGTSRRHGDAGGSGGGDLAAAHRRTSSLLPFDFHIHSPQDRLCVVLGLNSTGKSVLLSAIALMVFLAHLGCGVPAQHMALSLMSSILCASPVPSSTGGSSFYAECVALGRVLAHCEEEKRALRCAVHHACVGLFHAAKRTNEAGKKKKQVEGRLPALGTPVDAEASSLDGDAASFPSCSSSSLRSPVTQVSGMGPTKDDGEAERSTRRSMGASNASSHLPLEGRSGLGRDCFSALLQYFRPSLVVMDELGKGTAPEDGRALLGSVLRYFSGHSLSSSSSSDDVSEGFPHMPLDPALSLPSTMVEACLHDLWRPIVLCATYFTEVLDFTRDLQLHRFAPSAAFPFAEVQLYEMQSAGVFRRGAPIPPHSAAAAAAASGLFATAGVVARPAVQDTPPLQKGETSGHAGPSSGVVDHHTQEEEKEEGVLVDVIPIYLPYPITASHSVPATATTTTSSSSLSSPQSPCLSREEQYYYYMDHAGGWCGGPILGRRCGLHPRVLQFWQDTLQKLRQPTSVEGERRGGGPIR